MAVSCAEDASIQPTRAQSVVYLTTARGNGMHGWHLVVAPSGSPGVLVNDSAPLLCSNCDKHFTGTDKSISGFRLTQFVGYFLPHGLTFRLVHPCQHLVQSTE